MVETVTKAPPVKKAVAIEGEDATLVGRAGVTHKFYEVNKGTRVATEAFRGKVGENEIIAAGIIQIDTGYRIQILADGFTPEALSRANEYEIALTAVHLPDD